jgi:serine/threonine protein kinase
LTSLPLSKKPLSLFQDKRQQLLKEIKTLCEAQQASASHGLVEFYGAFYAPESGQVSIALEYMDGGSLADIVRVVKTIPEPILSKITHKVLQGLAFLHQ